MPLYEYHDPETGVSVELRRRIEDRDKPIILQRRSKVPERIGINGIGPTGVEAFDAQILQAYYKKEQKEGSRFQSSYSKEQLARTWKDG